MLLRLLLEVAAVAFVHYCRSLGMAHHNYLATAVHFVAEAENDHHCMSSRPRTDTDFLDPDGAYWVVVEAAFCVGLGLLPNHPFPLHIVVGPNPHYEEIPTGLLCMNLAGKLLEHLSNSCCCCFPLDGSQLRQVGHGKGEQSLMPKTGMAGGFVVPSSCTVFSLLFKRQPAS